MDLNSIPSTHISASQLPVTPALGDLIPLTPGPLVLMVHWPLNHLPLHRHAHMHIIKIKFLKRSLQERHDVQGHGTPKSRARISPGTIASHQSPACELATPQAFVCLHPTQVWHVCTHTNTHVHTHLSILSKVRTLFQRAAVIRTPVGNQCPTRWVYTLYSGRLCPLQHTLSSSLA